MNAIDNTIFGLTIHPVLLLCWLIFCIQWINALQKKSWRWALDAINPWVTMLLVLLSLTLMPVTIEMQIDALFGGRKVAVYIESTVMILAVLSYMRQIRDERHPRWGIIAILIASFALIYLEPFGSKASNRVYLRFVRNTALLLPIVFVFIPHHIKRLSTHTTFGERVRDFAMVLLFITLALLSADVYPLVYKNFVSQYGFTFLTDVRYRRIILFILTTTALWTTVFIITSSRILQPLSYLVDRWRLHQLSLLHSELLLTTEKKFLAPTGSVEDQLYETVKQIMDMVRLDSQSHLVLDVRAVIERSRDDSFENLVDALVKVPL